MDLEEYLSRAVREIGQWQAQFGPYERHPAVGVDGATFDAAYGELVLRQLEAVVRAASRVQETA